MPQGKLTKKEISRYSKKELLAICRKSGIKCNTKSSKAMLVAEVLRNKDIRSTLAVKGKRAMTQKQKDNLARFRFKKKPITNQESQSAIVNKPVPVASVSVPNPKSRVKVNPRGSNKTAKPCDNIKENVAQELALGKSKAIQTPTLPQPKIVGDDVKIVGKVKIMEEEFRDDLQTKALVNTEYKFEKRTRDRASLHANKLHHQHTQSQDTARQGKSTSHTTRLLHNLNTNRKIVLTRIGEFQSSTHKSTDLQDRRILNKSAVANENEMKEATKEAKQDDRDFDEETQEALIPTKEEKAEQEGNMSRIARLTLLNAKLKSGEIDQREFDARLKDIIRGEQAQKESEQQLGRSPIRAEGEELNQKLLEVLTKINDAIEKKKTSVTN